MPADFVGPETPIRDRDRSEFATWLDTASTIRTTATDSLDAGGLECAGADTLSGKGAEIGPVAVRSRPGTDGDREKEDSRSRRASAIALNRRWSDGSRHAAHARIPGRWRGKLSIGHAVDHSDVPSRLWAKSGICDRADPAKPMCGYVCSGRRYERSP